MSQKIEKQVVTKSQEQKSVGNKTSEKKASKKRNGAPTSVLFRRPIPMWTSFVIFLLPIFLAFIIGFIWPFVQGIYLSFCEFTTISEAKFTGIGNYVKAVTDSSFLYSFGFTALFALVSLLLINLLAFIVAYFLTLGMKGANLFRTAFFMPNLIGGIVLGYIWSMIFNGVLVNFKESIVLKTQYGFWGLIILLCWQQVGYMMIIYIAGLQGVSEDLMEAANIDGASKWQTLIHVTIPNIMPSITICLFLTLTNGFKLFDQNLALTNGQPFDFTKSPTIKTTEMMALNIYNTFYGQNHAARGIAQAKAVVFFLLVATISIIQLNATRSKEVQQ